MKSFQLILLVVFGFIALLGLVLFATSHGIGGAKNAPLGPVKVWGTLPQAGMDATLSSLRDSDKRFNELTYVEKSLSTFDGDLANAIAEGNGPDLIIITQEQLLTEHGKISVIPSTSISERDFIDAYAPMAQLYLTPDGTYGIPFVLDPLVLFYNTSMLAGAGLANAPATWEAVSGLAQTFTTRTSAGAVTRATVPLGDYGNITDARALLSLLLLQSGNSIVTSSSAGYASSINGDDTTAASAVNFFTQFANPAKTVYTWNRSLPASRDAFLAGDLLLYPAFASERPGLAAANPNLGFDVAAIPQPSTLTNHLTYGLLYAFAVPRASKNSNGALAAAFALSTPNASAAAATTLSMAPASRSALGVRPTDRYAAIFYPQALIAQGWISPSPSTVDGIFSGMIANLVSGRAEVEQALTTAGQSLDASLR